MASMRRIWCVVVMVMVMVFGVGVVSERAQATGIPTVDIAAIVQSLTSYITDLQQFAELISQTGIETQQLASALQQYEQTLREYQHYVNQIRSLQSIISAEDWRGLMTIIVGSPYGEELLGKIPELSMTDPEYKDKVRETLQEYGPVPQKTEDVITDYEVLGVNASDLAHIEAYNNALNKEFDQQIAQLNMTSRNNGGILAREGKWEKASEHILSLGEESDLATAQLGLSQDVLAGWQREAAMRQQNQMLLIYESPSTALANRRAGMVEEELERLKKVHANSNNFKAGKSHWGN